MSFERAYRACRLCIEYCSDINKGPEYFRLRDQANFEAMRALERMSHKDIANKALTECATCDYKSSRIAKLLKIEKIIGDSD